MAGVFAFAPMGLPGAGKSTLVLWLQSRKPELRVVSRDAIRAAMFERCSYTSEEKEAAFSALLSALDVHFAFGWPVAVDGACFSEPGRLERVADAAAAGGVPLVAVYCDCPVELASRRVERDRCWGKHVAADRERGLVERTAARFRPIPDWVHVVDTSRPVEEVGAEVIALLESAVSEPRPRSSA